MSFTDKTYFRGELTIANLSSLPVEESLGYFITKYETEFLNKVLGFAFAKLFIAGLTVVDPATPDQRWLDLKYGKDFTYQTVEGNWPGFVNSAKVSPLANFIYYHFTRDQVTQTAGIGQVQTKGENSTSASSVTKLVRAYNEMVNMQIPLITFLLANPDEYPEFKFNPADIWSLSYSQWYNYWLNHGYWPVSHICDGGLYKRINAFNI